MTSEPAKPAAVWKRVVAAILDFFTAFFVFGWLIAKYTGETTESGFDLQGGPAIALFVLIVAYFFIGRRHAGGTLWDRIFRIGRPQPN
jgi:hypothetical protein